TLDNITWIYRSANAGDMKLNRTFEHSHLIRSWMRPETLQIVEIDTVLVSKTQDFHTVSFPDERDWLLTVEGITIQSETAALNRRHEITLTSTNSSNNAQRDINLWVTFTHESGHTEMLRGFWDGDDTWKIRFKPAKLGEWIWSTNCSDPSNSGLH